VFRAGHPADGELHQPLLGQRLVHTAGQLHRQLPELIGQDRQRITSAGVNVRCHVIRQL
jgi:hypothetical protein